MNKIRLKYKLLSVLLFLWICSSCDSIHEFPTVEVEEKVDINISLNFKFKSLRGLDTTDSELTIPDANANNSNIRVIICIYRNGNFGEEVERRVVYLGDVPLNTIQLNEHFLLDIDKYYALAWVDYVDKDTRSDKFYMADNLLSVYYKEPLVGNTEYKDCFSAIATLDLTPYRGHREVKMEVEMNVKRHVAKYALIANDVERYLTRSSGRSLSEIDAYWAKVTYSTYMPNSYNVQTGLPNDSKPGLYYIARLNTLGNGEVLLCFDYLLVAQNIATVGVQIFDHNNELVNEVNDIRIPIARDSLTVIRSDFLSRKYAPGISIDPKFDGSFDIVLDD